MGRPLDAVDAVLGVQAQDLPAALLGPSRPPLPRPKACLTITTFDVLMAAEETAVRSEARAVAGFLGLTDPTQQGHLSIPSCAVPDRAGRAAERLRRQ